MQARRLITDPVSLACSRSTSTKDFADLATKHPPHSLVRSRQNQRHDGGPSAAKILDQVSIGSLHTGCQRRSKSRSSEQREAWPAEQ